MLQIKGELSLLDTLQMLKVLEGSYVVRTQDHEIHVKDGIITWFSGGDEEKCIDYIASYKGQVQVESGTVRESFSLPIDDAVLQATFRTPYENPQEDAPATCPTPETGWFAFVRSDRITASQKIDQKLVKEILTLWKTTEEAFEELSELISAGEEGIYHVVREGDAFIIGYCRDPKMLGILRQAMRRLKKHVHKGAKR